MRTSVYAVLAVVVGVMLVGLLPGQLSNFAALAGAKTIGLQSGAAPESTLNRTTANGNGTSNGTYTISGTHLPSPKNNTGFVDSTGSDASTTSAATSAPATASETDTASGAETAGAKSYNSYADLGYYAMWGVGLLAALGVYLISRRMLG
jgi:hypothetical protein